MNKKERILINFTSPKKINKLFEKIFKRLIIVLIKIIQGGSAIITLNYPRTRKSNVLKSHSIHYGSSSYPFPIKLSLIYYYFFSSINLF